MVKATKVKPTFSFTDFVCHRAEAALQGQVSVHQPVARRPADLSVGDAENSCQLPYRLVSKRVCLASSVY